MASTYFADHMPRRQYAELSEMYSLADPDGHKILLQALMRRAMLDVQRIMQIREEKPQLQNLVRSGVVGDAMMENITRAEKELDQEVQELVTEAELYKTGWGQTIFQEAGQMLQLQAQAQAQKQAQQQKPKSANPAPAPVPAAAAEKPKESKKQPSLPLEVASKPPPARVRSKSPPAAAPTLDSDPDDLPELVTEEELQRRADEMAAQLLREEAATPSSANKKKNKSGKKRK
ncbi:translocation protein S66 [Physocladia obscura]|uniref:Translocation protein S66 n=1 Tax=Physocladia obscura TaxID=109957 RepID=A0AAD5XI80_9FUNG|nr:translocation protein S66 [Physocladia obscura]